ncbi:MAG: family radical protein [Chitinophagaceae bacterium]|nr:family radical protein [Chitinophagaceae bacterium]
MATWKGRASQSNPDSKFSALQYERTNEFLPSDEEIPAPKRTIFLETPKKIMNPVAAEDLGSWSLNPYQGCEHGCMYCYARPTHEYWGFGAGLDFETKLVVKKNAPELLRQQLSKPTHKVGSTMLAGNTDCYQPIEREYKITRELLKVFLEFKHPVDIITKNHLVLRDLDILSELGKQRLTRVTLSINSLNEEVRRRLEPRTATAKQRLKCLEELSKAGVPCGTMIGPVIPGINHTEIPEILKQSAAHGASYAHYNIVRLAGPLGELFSEWLEANYPDRKDKVMHQIAECHGGKINDSRSGVRMSGEGAMAQAISQLFKISHKKYFKDKVSPKNDYTLYSHNGQLKLF